MPRGPAAALGVGAWLRRSARLWGQAQRLLVFPLGGSAIAVLLALAPALAAGEASGFTQFAGYAVSIEERIVDGMAGEVDVSAGEWVAVGGWLAATQLVFAWATAAFTRSVAEGRLVRVPSAAVLLRSSALFLAAGVLTVPILALAASEDYAGLALPLWALLNAGLLVTAYAIAIDELTIRGALAANLETLRRSPFAALAAFWLLLATSLLVEELFDQTIADADDVFPPFLLAAALAHGLRAYLLDCSLIVLYLGDREP